MNTMQLSASTCISAKWSRDLGTRSRGGREFKGTQETKNLGMYGKMGMTACMNAGMTETEMFQYGKRDLCKNLYTVIFK